MGTEATVEKWVMPEWMESYREHIVNTGGNEVEDLIHRLNTEQRLAATNFPVFTLAVAVKSQVSLLKALHANEMLTDSELDERPFRMSHQDPCPTWEGTGLTAVPCVLKRKHIGNCVDAMGGVLKEEEKS